MVLKLYQSQSAVLLLYNTLNKIYHFDYNLDKVFIILYTVAILAYGKDLGAMPFNVINTQDGIFQHGQIWG